MATAQDVYSRVSSVLLEPAGLTLGLYTEAQFLLDLWQVVGDFLQRTGLVRSLVNLPVTANTAAVGYPDYAMDVQDAFFDDRYIRRESALAMDNLEGNWRTATSTRPERWHEDRLPIKTVQVQPIPTRTGNRVLSSSTFYGTLSAVTEGATFGIVGPAGFYGTIASITGPMAVQLPAPLYGTISQWVTSAGNATLVATMKPALDAFRLTTEIEFVPDSFVSYLSYGVLAKVFSRDGETRDVLRERFCTARWEEGLNLAKVMSDEAMEEGEE